MYNILNINIINVNNIKMSIDEYTHKITICPDAVYIRNEKSTNTIYITMKDIEVK